MSDLDIFDCMAEIVSKFRLSGLEPPTVIELASFQEGARVLSNIEACNRGFLSVPLRKENTKTIEGTLFMEVQLMGVTIRFPVPK